MNNPRAQRYVASVAVTARSASTGIRYCHYSQQVPAWVSRPRRLGMSFTGVNMRFVYVSGKGFLFEIDPKVLTAAIMLIQLIL